MHVRDYPIDTKSLNLALYIRTTLVNYKKKLNVRVAE